MKGFDLKKLYTAALKWIKGHRLEAALCAAAAVAVLAVAIAYPMLSGGGAEDGGAQSADDGPITVETVDASEFIGTVLEESAPADREYVDETLFVGDSNTYRFMIYGKATLKNCIGIVGMGVSQFTSEKCVKFEGQSAGTIPEAITIMQPRRIVLTFGTNDYSLSPEKFIEGYEKVLESVRDAYPYADVIINAVPPVARERLYTGVTMDIVNAFNSELAKLAEKCGVRFLNSTEALLDPSTGYMKKDYTLDDGIHFSKKSTEAFFEYFMTHALISEDTRPKLKPVPERDEPEPYIISSDIVYYTDKVELEFTVNDASLGSVSGDTMQSVKAGGSAEAVSAVAKDGCRFVRWECSVGSIADVGSETLVFNVPAGQKESIVITAVFEPESAFAVSVASDTDGCRAYIVSGSEYVGSINVREGDAVTIKAYPAEGYKVTGLYSGYTLLASAGEFGSDGDGYVCSFKPQSDSALTVSFAPYFDAASLVSVEPAGAASVSSTQSGSSITYVCTPSSPDVYGFDGWYVNGALASSERTLNVSYRQGLTVKAVLHEHSFGAQTVVQAPTADSEGTAKCSCTVCGAEKTVTLPAQGGGVGTLPDTPATPEIPDLPTPPVPDTPDGPPDTPVTPDPGTPDPVTPDPTVPPVTDDSGATTSPGATDPTAAPGTGTTEPVDPTAGGSVEGGSGSTEASGTT